VVDLIKIDLIEPREIEALIGQTVQTTRLALNSMGYADYVWSNIRGEVEQIERKRVAEVLAGMPEIEYQLRNEIKKVPATILIVEGIAEPHPQGIRTYVVSKDGRFFRSDRVYKTPYALYEGWLVALARAGITVWKTASWVCTAEAIVRFMKSSDKLDSDILVRQLKRVREYDPNPHVETLMHVSGGKVGPKLAAALVVAFGTAWDVIRQEPEVLAESVEGFGIKRARDLLEAIGRKV